MAWLCRLQVQPDTRLFAGLLYVAGEAGRLDAVQHVRALLQASDVPHCGVRSSPACTLGAHAHVSLSLLLQLLSFIPRMSRS